MQLRLPLRPHAAFVEVLPTHEGDKHYILCMVHTEYGVQCFTLDSDGADALIDTLARLLPQIRSGLHVIGNGKPTTP